MTLAIAEDDRQHEQRREVPDWTRLHFRLGGETLERWCEHVRGMDELICSEHVAIEIDEVAVGVADPVVFDAHVDVASQNGGRGSGKVSLHDGQLEGVLACLPGLRATGRSDARGLDVSVLTLAASRD